MYINILKSSVTTILNKANWIVLANILMKDKLIVIIILATQMAKRLSIYMKMEEQVYWVLWGDVIWQKGIITKQLPIY